MKSMKGKWYIAKAARRFMQATAIMQRSWFKNDILGRWQRHDAEEI